MYADDNPNALPTVRIKHDDFPDGLIINADAFDSSKHELFDDTSSSKSRKKKSEPENNTDVNT